MEWRDEGVVLAVRRHGETAAIIDVFTPGLGRHAGVVRGGASRRLAPLLQPGAQLDLSWRGRLEEHIGSFTVEPLRSRMAALSDRMALAGLNAVAAMLLFALPDREPHLRLYTTTIALLDGLGGDGWALDYLRWELTLLEEMGYGLDLSACAVTGVHDDLVYVSPKSGRAVSRAGAGDWADRLLPLPACLLGQGGADAGDLAAGLRLTGYFLEHHLARDLRGRALPEARARLLALIARLG
ncbi:MAG: DNA repair protein RecO [Rhodobacteraceae bacterium]|nr:DNA repair protein RecO [Paracoccaceae bacterium]